MLITILVGLYIITIIISLFSNNLNAINLIFGTLLYEYNIIIYYNLYSLFIIVRSIIILFQHARKYLYEVYLQRTMRSQNTTQ